jgi:diguanylate cyclase (GGDEF)-like protein/PAS domain S-box-containing protein
MPDAFTQSREDIDPGSWFSSNKPLVLNAIGRSMLLAEWDSDGCLIWANEIYRRCFDAALETLRARPYAQHFQDPAGAAQRMRKRWAALPAGASFRQTIDYLTPDGEVRWIDATYIAVKSPADGAVRILVAGSDITAPRERDDHLQRLLLGVSETDNAVIVSDGEHRIVHVNAGFERMFSFDAHEARDHTVARVLGGAAPQSAIANYLARRIANADGYREELLVHDKQGKPMWVAAVANAVFDAEGRLLTVVDVLTDITATKVCEVLQRNVLQTMVAEAPIGLILEVICKEVGRLVPEIAAAVLSVDLHGLMQPLAAPDLPPVFVGALRGQPVGPAMGPAGSAAYCGVPVLAVGMVAGMPAQLSSDWRLPEGYTGCWSHPVHSSEGRVIGIFVFYFHANNKPDNFLARLADVCVYLCSLALEREEARARIRQLAFYDELTGLPNRRFLHDQAERLIADMGRRKEPLALLFVSIGRFKQINDTLGHSMGDALLREIARRLRSVVRSSDIIGRLSGDEFVVVLPQCDAAGVTVAAKHVMTQLSRPFEGGDKTVTPLISVGVSLFPENGRDMDTLLRHADMAMSQAKAAGRNRVHFFSPEMNSLAQEKHAMETALREAIEHDTLELHYQPQLNLVSGQLHGVEALARWSHPRWGSISPTRFVPLAEECGLIDLLGAWALDTACRQLRDWRRRGTAVPSVSVNLSPTNFHDEGLPAHISGILGQYGLAPADLTLEMTESVLMDSNPGTMRTIKSLHALGVRMSMDDFGTGYSSLGYLRRLPVHELKLDRSFVQGIENDKAARALAHAIIRIGDSLDLTVVAEGVENEEQLRFLCEHGCNAAQGFLFAPALPGARLEAWLLERRQRLGPL